MKRKVKVFQHNILKPAEHEKMMQEWFDKIGNIEVDFINTIAVDAQYVQTTVFYREVPATNTKPE